MSLAIDRDLETKIRARAEAEGLSVEAYLERLVHADQEGAKELEALALEGCPLGRTNRSWTILVARETSPPR